MKHPVASWLLFLAVPMIGYAAILAYSSKYNSVAMASAESVLKSIEADRKALANYPEKVEIEPTRILGVLPGPKLKYLVAGADCSVYYEKWPLGPKAIKNCGGGEWHYEE